MTLEAEEDLLAHGSIEVVGRVTGSSNQALLVEVTRGSEEALACYKCERGERPLWDFPAGLWRREVAAYRLDRLLGTDLVPATVARYDAPFGPGSLQWWVDDDDSHYFTLRERPEVREWLVRLAVFDHVCNNADRKGGHVLFDGERPWAIDNGLTFNVEDKLRTVVWDFVGEPIPEWLGAALTRLARGDSGDLDQWLEPDELRATRRRAGQLARRGQLPEPDEERDWPPYPWPLI